MRLTIAHFETSIVFDLMGPTPLQMLVVSDSLEQVQWEIKASSSREHVQSDIKPASSSEPQPILQSGFVGVRVPESIGNVVQKQFESERSNYPQVSRVIYGGVPSGFHELVKPMKLAEGQRYCVLVWGVGFDSASDFFIA